MQRATMTKGKHDPSCTGCPVCSDDAARLLRMDTAEYAAWLSGRNRSLAATKDTPRFRTSAALPQRDRTAVNQGPYSHALASTKPEVVRSAAGVPLPYQTALARLRANKGGAR